MTRLRQTTTATYVAVLAAAAAVGPSMLFVDKPLAWFCRALGPGVRAACGYLSWTAGFPAAFVACTVMLALALYVVRARKQPVAAGVKFLFVPVATGLSWSLGTVAKVVFGRARPELLLEHGVYGFRFLRTEYEFNSFPSGHAVVATSFLFALSLILPRWRWPLWALAVLIGLSRVAATAHYLSDVLGAAVLSVLVVSAVRRVFHQRGFATQPEEE